MSFAKQNINQEPENNLIPLTQELVMGFFKSENPYPVDFEEAWQWLDYSSKGKAKRLLTKNFIENEHYIFALPIGQAKNGRGGHNRESIFLSKDCFKDMAMLAETAQGKIARKYFRACETALKELKNKQAQNTFKLPGSFPEALRLLASEVEKNQEQEKRIQKLLPMAEYGKLSFNAIQSAPLSSFGKYLSDKVPGMGKNRISKFLIENKLVFRNRQGMLEPYSQYLNADSKQKYFGLKEKVWNRPVLSKDRVKIGETKEVYFQILIIKSGMEKVIELCYSQGLIDSQQYFSITNDLPIWIQNNPDLENHDMEFAEIKSEE